MDKATCKTCRFWNSRDGDCGRLEMGDQNELQDNGAIIVVRVADDYNLDAKLYTGPDFGCTLHQTK